MPHGGIIVCLYLPSRRNKCLASSLSLFYLFYAKYPTCRCQPRGFGTWEGPLEWFSVKGSWIHLLMLFLRNLSIRVQTLYQYQVLHHRLTTLPPISPESNIMDSAPNSCPVFKQIERMATDATFLISIWNYGASILQRLFQKGAAGSWWSGRYETEPGADCLNSQVR